MSADQFRMSIAPFGSSLGPSSVSFDASSAAQSATSPALFAGSSTATPLEHCSVNWLLCRWASSDASALKAVAVGASARNPIATATASAVSAASEIALAELMLNRRVRRISYLISML